MATVSVLTLNSARTGLSHDAHSIIRRHEVLLNGIGMKPA
jgi:hypothetical protein